MDVALVRWPEEHSRRSTLAEQGRLRLLLVDRRAAAPTVDDWQEDWIRLPADEADVEARIEGLERRAAALGGAEPALDPDGVLRFAGSWVSLPPVEARLMGALVERFGAVVRRDQLASAGWPDGAPGRNALDVHVLRLRRRIEPLQLAIRTVRSRGYLLEMAGSSAAIRSERDVPGTSSATKHSSHIHVREA